MTLNTKAKIRRELRMEFADIRVKLQSLNTEMNKKWTGLSYAAEKTDRIKSASDRIFRLFELLDKTEKER